MNTIKIEIQTAVSNEILSKVFPNGRFCDLSDLEDISAELDLSQTEPFFIDKQAAHCDYYCIDLTSGKITVFAVHDFVYEWVNLNSFIQWIKKQSLDIRSIGIIEAAK